ncbi:hypothetical protein HDV00_005322 [Rhizophlyctis rosea]|nr:hypothetical protein HDV00_005322 [Rhizophlyctis rosea]
MANDKPSYAQLLPPPPYSRSNSDLDLPLALPLPLLSDKDLLVSLPEPALVTLVDFKEDDDKTSLLVEYTTSTHSAQSSSEPSFLTRILFKLATVTLLLAGSIALIWQLAITLPRMDSPTGAELGWPKTLQDLRSQSELLRAYSNTYTTHVLALFTAVFLFKQAWAVPGASLMNILAGVLYGFWGFWLVSILTAIGSTMSYWLSQMYLGELLLERFARGKLQYFRRHVESNKENLFYYLLFVRLFPLSPSWFLNLASPFVGIPVAPFFFSVLFGLMPFNYVCIQAAATLSEVETIAELFNLGTLLRLMSISALALIPALCGRRVSGICKRILKVAAATPIPGSPIAGRAKGLPV